MTIKHFIYTLALSMALTIITTRAETILIPINSQGADLRGIKLPTTGEIQQSIREQYGEPDSISGPTGKPPISRWNYRQFSVYFESDRVIHSVLKHQRQSSSDSTSETSPEPAP